MVRNLTFYMNLTLYMLNMLNMVSMLKMLYMIYEKEEEDDRHLTHYSIQSSYQIPLFLGEGRLPLATCSFKNKARKVKAKGTFQRLVRCRGDNKT